MNPFLIKTIGIVKKVTATGLIKPLPLSGIGKEVSQVWEKKASVKGWLRLAAYLIGGCLVWAMILGKITFAQLLELLKVFGI